MIRLSERFTSFVEMFLAVDLHRPAQRQCSADCIGPDLVFVPSRSWNRVIACQPLGQQAVALDRKQDAGRIACNQDRPSLCRWAAIGGNVACTARRSW